MTGWTVFFFIVVAAVIEHRLRAIEEAAKSSRAILEEIASTLQDMSLELSLGTGPLVEHLARTGGRTVPHQEKPDESD